MKKGLIQIAELVFLIGCCFLFNKWPTIQDILVFVSRDNLPKSKKVDILQQLQSSLGRVFK